MEKISVCLKSLPSNCEINVAVDIVYILKPVIVKWMKIICYLKGYSTIRQKLVFRIAKCLFTYLNQI